MTGSGDEVGARRARFAQKERAPSADGWVRENVCAHCDHAGPACQEGPQFALCLEAVLDDEDRQAEMREDLLADAPGPCKVCQLWDLEEGCIGRYDPGECAAMDEADLRHAGGEI